MEMRNTVTEIVSPLNTGGSVSTQKLTIGGYLWNHGGALLNIMLILCGGYHLSMQLVTCNQYIALTIWRICLIFFSCCFIYNEIVLLMGDGGQFHYLIMHFAVFIQVITIPPTVWNASKRFTDLLVDTHITTLHKVMKYYLYYFVM